MTPITLTEAEARAVYGVLTKEPEAVPQGEEMFVDSCREGDADRITFLGSRSPKSWAGSRGRKLIVQTSRFSVVAGPLRVLCSEDAVSTSQIWAAADASSRIADVLAELREAPVSSLPFRVAVRERLSVLAA